MAACPKFWEMGTEGGSGDVSYPGDAHELLYPLCPLWDGGNEALGLLQRADLLFKVLKVELQGGAKRRRSSFQTVLFGSVHGEELLPTGEEGLEVEASLIEAGEGSGVHEGGVLSKEGTNEIPLIPSFASTTMRAG